MSVAKLKEKARNFEVKNQTEKAIEAYVEIINQLEGEPEMEDELALFNKVGDLYQKAGNVQAAVDMWERGVNHYADGGFHNNAIALCNKILRNAPARTQVYLMLAKLMLGRGFVAEAKQHLLEYAERMKKVGQLDAAFTALKEFADLSAGDNDEIRLLLAEQLKAGGRHSEAREQLAKLYHETKGDARRSRMTVEKMKAIDPDYDVEKAPEPKQKPKKTKSSDLVFLDLGEDTRGPPPAPPARVTGARAAPLSPKGPPKPAPKPPEPEPEPVEIEPTSLVEETPEPVEAGDVEIPRPEVELEGSGAGAGPVDGLMGSAPDAAPEVAPLDFEPAEAPLDLEPAEPPPEPEVPAEIPFLGVPELEPAAEEELPAAAAAGLDVPELDLGGFGEEAGVTIEVPPEEAEPAALELNIEVGPLETGVAAGPPDIKTLEAKVANNPDDAQLHQALGEALLELGQRERALEELDIALGRIEAQEDWVQAEDLADEILRLDPNSVRHHQKRVEYAFRRNDKGRLVEAYLGLSDGLMRSGALERARAVYQRVLEHDPQNPRALSALSTLEPAPEERKVSIKKPAAAAPTAAEDFVDLGSFILEEPVRLGDARLRVQDEEPTGDEQRDFEDMLTQFKKGIEASLGAEDVQAHYDLGVAFKEMGLLDEAIGEFQKALRGTEGRLRTSEALGTCFFEKRQFNVAATVLRRAVETDQGGDEAKIGLLYWLGRCEEEMGRPAEALGFYQRVFAVDIGFQDVSDRVASLAKVGR